MVHERQGKLLYPTFDAGEWSEKSRLLGVSTLLSPGGWPLKGSAEIPFMFHSRLMEGLTQDNSDGTGKNTTQKVNSEMK